MDADLESGRTPVDELHRAFRFELHHGRIHVLRTHIATIHQCEGQVLALGRVTLDLDMLRVRVYGSVDSGPPSD